MVLPRKITSRNPGDLPVRRPGHDRLIRLGGLAIIAGLMIHIILNFLVKEFPPEDPTPAEFQDYLSRETASWTIVHGFRYLAFFSIVIFASGLFARTGLLRSNRSILISFHNTPDTPSFCISSPVSYLQPKS